MTAQKIASQYSSLVGLFSFEICPHEAASKIRQFDFKISEMCAKYKMSFEDFKRRIESRIGEEAFEEWDDFIIWERS